MKHLIHACPVLFSLLVNCVPPKSLDQIPDAKKLLQYERTPCFGFCQTYQVTILRNGQAFFVGRQFTPVEDTINLVIPGNILTQIISILDHPEYLDYELEEPEYHITDIPGLLLSDYRNDRQYDLDIVIPPAIEQITNIVDQVLTHQELIYDRKTYPTIREDILVQLTPGTDPGSLTKRGEIKEINYQKEVGNGIHLYTIYFSIMNKDKVLNEVNQMKGVQTVQFNHRLQRR